MHRISGFIGRLEMLREATAPSEGERVVPLAQGFGFLPIVERLKAPADPGPFPEMERLMGRLASWAAEQSHRFLLAYVETEYWAGRGGQGAVVWQAGAVVFGPAVTSNEDLPEDAERPPPSERAINRAAQMLGVARGDAFDEFDVLGLGRYRSNDDWLVASNEAPDA
jgi:hypothetical protein